jgi:RNA polymerase sigma-70 factor (ECF subfamily)
MALSEKVFDDNKKFLWGVCYRMTGNAADAEDLVQETFARALEKPPADASLPLRGWLVQVAINLSRDFIRRRRRQPAPWLPSPIPTDEEEAEESTSPDSPAARYDLMESVSQAFLLALEALTPSQRAVLLLRDVFDYSTAETARLLAMSENRVKVTLHRARRCLRDYDRKRKLIASRREKTRRALEEFLRCLKANDMEGLERLLAKDVVVVSDGGGEVVALASPLTGRRRVAQLIIRLNAVYRRTTRVSYRNLNGETALVFHRSNAKPGHASRFTMHCEVDEAGRIERLNYVFAPSKLAALS